MTVKELFDMVKSGEVEIPGESSFMMVYTTDNGDTEMAGSVKPEWLKALGVQCIEMAVRNKIKEAL